MTNTHTKLTNLAGPEVPSFTQQEFERRVERARELMTLHRLDGLVLTSEANIEYLAGFVTQFAWTTPSRPWYFVVPRIGDAAAVIPEIGITNWLETSWCRNIQTWPSPRPDDEGLTLLTPLLLGIPGQFGRIGFEIGPESRMGMPVRDFLTVRDALSPRQIDDCTLLMAELRAVKSTAGTDHIRHICRIAGETFAHVPDFVKVGDSERDICRKFAADLLLRGADKVPYTSIGTGQGGYSSIIMGPTDRGVAAGDVLIIDTGAKYGGYFCDFDRNFSFGTPSDEVVRIHDVLWLATEAGIAAARPGNTAADVFLAQARVLEEAGIPVGNVGRFGHGLGKLITEYPSNAPGDTTVLKPGMVLTIEPSAMYGDYIMAHEEDILITEGDPELLTPRASREITRIG
ncbi:M24 family metallopeptidase [Microvirga aerophila]|uniref:Peptidase M24 n=1 Tax=Microvirga aerophila TaxID=670291 RepID=A0A512C4D1_9HYPH|nr:Xaa-Pro peptidase family protein [Microvirga aerophila]GEO19062.1 peptidase M24 [Microvirga aerophila]